MDTRTPRSWVALVVLLGTIVRLAPLVLPFEFSGPDSVTYLEPARGLLERGSYSDPSGPTAVRPPGYPLFLALCLLVGQGSPFAVRLAQALLGGLAAAGVLLVLWRTTRPRWAIAGGLLCALDPIAVGQSPWILREALLLALLTGLVWAWTCLRGRRRALAAGLLLAALALTHQLYVLLGAFLYLAHALKVRRRALGPALLPWVGMGLMVLLAAGLWARRVERVTGHFSLTATENPVPARELYLTTACPNLWLNGDPVTGFQADAWREEALLLEERGLEGTKAEFYRRWRANWREHPWRTLSRVLRQNLWYWLEIPGAIRLVEHPRLYPARWLLLPFHWVRLLCAGAGLLYLLRQGRWRDHCATLAALAFLAAAPALLYPVPRYLGPAAPLLDLLAAIGFMEAWDRRGRRRV